MFLRKLWYFALPGSGLKPGKMKHMVLLNEPLLIGRSRDGKPFALRDICPHRGIPLSTGHFDGDEVECPYHGWRFNCEGACTTIPSLVEGQSFKISNIGVQKYPCREVQGLIWVYFGEEGDTLPSLPMVPDFEDTTPQMSEAMNFSCDLDHAIIGLMDPAHGPYVHRSWWWRTKKSMHEKKKKFAPSHLGFTMVRHAPSSNSRAYKLLGGKPETEISFQLPGVRIEHVRVGNHRFAGLTAVVPISEDETRITQVFYWTMPWLGLIKPILRPFARTFIKQDKDIIVEQQKGLAYDPNLMLINDADVQAKWYFSIKKEYLRAEEDGRTFQNPVSEKVLRWRS